MTHALSLVLPLALPLATAAALPPNGAEAWFAAPAYQIAALDGSILSPGLAFDAVARRFALPVSMSPAQVLAATPAAIAAAMEECSFTDVFDFTRASAATYFDASGTLVTVAVDQPRLAQAGLLLENAATNYIRNSVLAGAVVGTLGGGGQLATNMSMSAAVSGDLVTSVAEIGVEYGYAYIDLRFVGQNTTPRFLNLESGTAVPGVAGDNRVFSAICRLVAGSLANISDLQLVLSERNSSGTNATGSPATTLDIKPTAASTARRSISRTMTATDAAFALPYMRIPPATGPVDFTIRFALFQCEAGLEATSPIQTNGSAVTRAADNAKLSAKAAAVLQRASVGLRLQVDGVKAVNSNVLGGAAFHRILGTSVSTATLFLGVTNGLQVANFGAYPAPAFGVAVGWDATGKAGSFNGGAVASHATVMDASMASIQLGRSASGNFAPGYYRQFVAWPSRPANAALPGKAVPYV